MKSEQGCSSFSTKKQCINSTLFRYRNPTADQMRNHSFQSIYDQTRGSSGTRQNKVVAIIQKKMKTTETTYNNGRLPDDLMFEVVRRLPLPLKSMCICKCVCKSWLSIISAPEFLNQWLRSRFVLSIRDGHDFFSDRRYLLGTLTSSSSSSSYSAYIDFEEWLSVSYTKYYGVTQAINGLVCFYESCHVWLFNLSTGEIMKLPFSHFNPRAPYFRYFFGFDPISSTYKLLKVDRYEYEILTLGENMCKDSWKNIKVECFPFKCVPEEEAVCVDGTLFWVQSGISFDLNRHYFRYLSLPELLSRDNCGAALQFKGRLAFACKGDNHLIIFSRKQKEYKWSKQSFQLPTELIQQWKNLTPFGSLPTGEIMLVDAEGDSKCICSYDPVSQKFESFVIGKLPPLKSKMDLARISCFEANFNPLSLILKQNTPRL